MGELISTILLWVTVSSLAGGVVTYCTNKELIKYSLKADVRCDAKVKHALKKASRNKCSSKVKEIITSECSWYNPFCGDENKSIELKKKAAKKCSKRMRRKGKC